MPNPTDMPFELTRTAMENLLRGVSLVGETQQQLMQLQLRAINDALSGSEVAMNEVTNATDWAALGALPSLLVRQNIERNAGMVQNCVKLMADTQASWLARLRDASESLQRCQADAMASGAAAGATFPMQAVFDRFNDMAQATGAAAARTTQSATQAAQTATQTAAQAASRSARRGEHA